MKLLNVFVAALSVVVEEALGHGMMLDPPNRSSLWRFDPAAPVNYDDNENFCGGYGVQWGRHGGKCGVCGDSYGDPTPRKNENTGLYGEGKVVKSYEPGSAIEIYVQLTTNHDGWFNYSLCALDDVAKPETEDCFAYLPLEDGSYNYRIASTEKHFKNHVKLPDGFKCERCVLRWSYKTANFWGICENGSSGMGCGPQEHFKNCADISIL